VQSRTCFLFIFFLRILTDGWTLCVCFGVCVSTAVGGFEYHRRQLHNFVVFSWVYNWCDYASAPFGWQSSQDPRRSFYFGFLLKGCGALFYSLHFFFYCRVCVLSVCEFGCAFVQSLEPTISRPRPHTNPTSPSTAAVLQKPQTTSCASLLDKSIGEPSFVTLLWPR
jgi:hypothetical protein